MNTPEIFEVLEDYPNWSSFALHPDEARTILNQLKKMSDALKVLTLTPSTRIWLAENDPKALAQAQRALKY